MLTRCPTARELEVFILHPEYSGRIKVKDHVDSCPYCQISVAELTRQWSALERMARPQADCVFVLLPTSDSAQIIAQPAMAAKGEKPVADPRGLTLASSDRVMWLKAVRDSHSEDVWLYLYSEDESLVPSNAVVRPFGMDRDFMTDDRGRINLGRISWPSKDLLRAEVRLPSAAFRLEEIGDLDRPSGEATLTSPAGDRIHVSWTMVERGRRITIEVQALADLLPETPLQVAVRARGVGTPVHIRSLQLEHPLTVEHPGALDRIEIFVYK